MNRVFAALLIGLLSTSVWADGINIPPTATGTAATGQIPGTTTNDDAAAGKVGEYLTANLASGSATSLSTSTAKTIISISLTAGDWDVWGIVNYTAAGTTAIVTLQASVSQVADTRDVTIDHLVSTAYANAYVIGAASTSVSMPPVRVSLSATTTVYLIAFATFNTSTLTGYGVINARRRR